MVGPQGWQQLDGWEHRPRLGRWERPTMIVTEAGELVGRKHGSRWWRLVDGAKVGDLVHYFDNGYRWGSVRRVGRRGQVFVVGLRRAVRVATTWRRGRP